MIISDPADFITVAEAKTHLNKTTSDSELEGFISAAERSIVERVGHVSTVTVEEDRSPSSATGAIVTEHRPVLSVTSIVELPGGDMVTKADRLTGDAGWYLDSPEGILRHTDEFPESVRVTYEAGREPVPGNIRMAALEMVAHLWRRSQHNQDRPGIGEPDGVIIPGVAYALPYAVRELLGLGRVDTDMPLVG